MKRLPSEPPRLLELRPQDDPVNLARLVRIATSTPAEPVPNLKGRIRCSLRVKSARRRRHLRAALLGSMILLTGSVVAAVAPPIIQLWQKQKLESVATIETSPPAARPRRLRASQPPSRAADQNLPTPVEPALPPSMPPEVAPAPPLPAMAESSALHPKSEVVPPWPRAEPTVARFKPSSPRVSVARPTSARDQPASPTLPHPASDRKPLRTAMLDPPSQPRWSPPATPSIPGVAPSVSAPAEPFAPQPSLPHEEGARARTAAGSIGRHSAPIPTAAPPVAPPGEQALLSKAIRSLRSEHRPERALVALDEYAARFPSGSLQPEATRLRAEALLALGHKPAALAELNREFAPGGPGKEKSRLVRGELHAAEGRWQEALDDFDAVVRAHEPGAGPSTSKLRERFERALWGRASARSHLGDDAGARTDLREYLRRFPQGRFAGQATHLLGEQR